MKFGPWIMGAVLFVALSTCVPDARAQYGLGTSELASDKALSAWKLQSRCTAQGLGLSAAQSRQLEQAYTNARTAHLEAARKLEEEIEDRGERYEALLKLRETQRARLERRLSGFLPKEQLARAIGPLGAFDTQGDGYVDALAGYGLSDASLSQALSFVNQYITASGKALREAVASQDYYAWFDARRELKEKLDASLASVLPERQLAQWKKSTSRRGRGLRRRRGLRIDYVRYRRARWEKEKVNELSISRINQGGSVCVYVTNTSESGDSLREWRLNDRGYSSYHQDFRVAWDRILGSGNPNDRRRIEPGCMGVVEICGISDDFAPGKPFRFSQSLGRGGAGGSIDTTLQEDPVQISFIRVMPEMDTIEVHFRNTGDEEAHLKGLIVNGAVLPSVQWASTVLAARGNGIVRAMLAKPLNRSELIIAGIEIEQAGGNRKVFAHRRAFPDYYPIGTWGIGGYEPAEVRHMHIDTCIQGGRSNDPFYSELAPRYGFKTLVHTGDIPKVDTIRDLGDHPSVCAWYLQDEPDSNRTVQQVAHIAETTHAYDSRKPSLITLCRMHKFSEYAGLPDIPVHDHYCVGAPSSSRWPRRYGTRLEETAYYTRELRWASEPKPIWVWTQGLFDWGSRRKQTVPTPDELAAQLLLNMGRGAKGILWFTIKHHVGLKYPATRNAIKGWGRVLDITRSDLLSAEPLEAPVKAPEKIDAVALVGWDRLFLFVFNQDYEIHDAAYPWTEARNVAIDLVLPEWLHARSAMALAPDGVTPVRFSNTTDARTRVTIDVLRVGRLIVLCNDSEGLDRYGEAHAETVAFESKAF
ncbi:MAG: hypothetical protein JSU70_01825 [Phycisphaerales bacterium]|nr:MAG: hypothetical protein JSU70_01825 [Phycisphaerales bacterium]